MSIFGDRSPSRILRLVSWPALPAVRVVGVGQRTSRRDEEAVRSSTFFRVVRPSQLPADLDVGSIRIFGFDRLSRPRELFSRISLSGGLLLSQSAFPRLAFHLDAGRGL